MGRKTFYQGQVHKARRRGDAEGAAYWQSEMDAWIERKRKLGKAGKHAESYQVQAGDNLFKLAEQVYGDQSYVTLLLAANPALGMLQPGMELMLPTKT